MSNSLVKGGAQATWPSLWMAPKIYPMLTCLFIVWDLRLSPGGHIIIPIWEKQKLSQQEDVISKCPHNPGAGRAEPLLCGPTLQDWSFPGAQWWRICLQCRDRGDLGSVPGLGKSPGEGNGSPLQYSGQENPKNRGAWQATVHGIAKSRTQLSN